MWVLICVEFTPFWLVWLVVGVVGFVFVGLLIVLFYCLVG